MIGSALLLAALLQHQHAAPGPAPIPIPTPAGMPSASSCSPQHAAMGHCTMPAAPAPARPPRATGCTPEHAAMGHCSLATPAAPTADVRSGTDLPAGNAPPPLAPAVDAADRIFGPSEMRPSRTRLYAEHGGGKWSQVMVNLAEVAIRDGRDGYRWDADAWFGGDRDRLVVKSEGEGDFGSMPEHVEVQALWSRAIGPYFDLQAGVRHDLTPNPSRTHAAVGFEGLAPYWFDVEGTIFLSDKGEVTARAEATYDQRITQQLILQPRVEVSFSAQDVPALDLGSGVTNVELGLRLRYEIVPEFAPYLGINWDRKLGDTARFARASGEGASDLHVVVGLRTWF